MHVAIVSPEFPPDIGGIETYACEFTRELARCGHQVTVFTRRHAEGEIALPGVEIRPLLRLRRHLDSAVLAAQRADVWHVMNAVYSWVALEKQNTVVSVHGNDFLRPYLPVAIPDLRLLIGAAGHVGREPQWLRTLGLRRSASLVGRTLPLARKILANSLYTERALLAQIPACAGRTAVAYPGVPSRFFDVSHRASADGVKRLLTVCRLSEPRKNVDLVLQALARIGIKRSFRYTVVGDGHDRPRLEAMARELGVAERVRFTGFVTSEQLLDFYADTDLMIMASSVAADSHEGFGIVYVEAAASGVPSLAARLAGAVEAVSEGVSGIFVDEPTVDALESRLTEFIEDKIAIDRSKCRNFARQFTYTRLADHALRHYAPAMTRD